MRFKEKVLLKIELWVKETCSLEGVSSWDWDDETLTIVAKNKTEYYSSDFVYCEIAPMFVVLDTSNDYPDSMGVDSDEDLQITVYDNFPTAVDKIIELNDNEDVSGIWEIFKIVPVSSDDIERWLPEATTPVGYLYDI